MILNLSNLAMVLGLATALGGIMASLYKIFTRFEKLEKQAAHRKDDDKIILESLLAVLEGLKEQGCNGRVTETRERLQQYLLHSR